MAFSDALRQILTSLKVIFLDLDATRGAAGGLGWRRHADPELLERLVYAIRLAIAELEDGGSLGNGAAESPDTVDALNALVAARPGETLTTGLENAFFEVLPDFQLELADLLRQRSPKREQVEFYLRHARQAVTVSSVLRTLCAEKLAASGRERLNPLTMAMLAGDSVLMEEPRKLVAVALLRDPFAASRVFRYGEGIFTPVTPAGIRGTAKFYGFHGPRQVFAEQLHEFAEGRGNVPLLVSSLPGLGKTQFTIAYTLAEPDLTLILAEPETLEGDLERLIGLLARRRTRRFVVFFDDVDPAKLNWYDFRTHIGGSMALPPNIEIVVASNYEFPANILSRGREVIFPVFDELRCQEMVADFLTDFGMKSVNDDLAAVMSSNYIEEFAQKKYTELSPRTLMRYLERYLSDPKLRRRILTLSQQELIIRPDAQVFYEFNLKVMKALYGKEYIDNLLQERLKNL